MFPLFETQKWLYKDKREIRRKFRSVLFKPFFQFKLVEVFSMFRHFMLAKSYQKESSKGKQNQIFFLQHFTAIALGNSK